MRQTRRRRRSAASGPRTSVVRASIAEMPVSTGSAGASAVRRVERVPGDRRASGAEDRRAAVERLAPAVAHPAEPAVTDRDPQRAAGEGDAGPRRAAARRCPRAPGRRRGRGRPRARPRGGPSPGVQADHGELVPADAGDPATTSSGPRISGDAEYSTQRRSGSASAVTRSPSDARQHRVPPGAATPAASSGPVSAAARSSGEKSSSSISAAGTRRASTSRSAARRPRPARRRRSAAVLRGRAVGVVGATARSAAAPPRAAAGRRAGPPARGPGSEPTPTRAASVAEPVGLGQQRWSPGRAGAAQSGSP